MKPLPHLYKVTVEGKPENYLSTSAENLPTLDVAAPKDFGGPGDKWSPEDLLMASIANCVVLTFRSIARISKLQWLTIQCESQGKLEKVDHQTKFTKITTKITLVIPPDESDDKAKKVLVKAEESCLIRNSLSAETHFECEIISE